MESASPRNKRLLRVPSHPADGAGTAVVSSHKAAPSAKPAPKPSCNLPPPYCARSFRVSVNEARRVARRRVGSAIRRCPNAASSIPLDAASNNGSELLGDVSEGGVQAAAQRGERGNHDNGKNTRDHAIFQGGHRAAVGLQFQPGLQVLDPSCGPSVAALSASRTIETTAPALFDFRGAVSLRLAPLAGYSAVQCRTFSSAIWPNA